MDAPGQSHDPAPEVRSGSGGRDRRVRRRTALAAGGAVVVAGATGVTLVETGVVRGRYRLNGLFGANGATVTAPDVPVGPITQGTFQSTAFPAAGTRYAIARPPNTEGRQLPVAVLLHGRGDDHNSPFTGIRVQNFLAEAVGQGVAPFAIATLDGAEGFWINRASGRWSDLVVDFLGELGRSAHQLDTSRLALTGYSMGGYGAMLLAAGPLHGRVRAVFAESPCLWRTAADAEAGAFDSAEHFAQNSPWRAEVFSGLADVPLTVTCGRNDPFCDPDRAWVATMKPTPESSFTWGDHSQNYWRSVSAQQMRFLGRHL